ncbi:MAG TPA: hypothetical protein ENH91_11415 [Leeuwenhoekiella sp.]|nr:hypothetical protein [Leeuwenhoekiella sp.]
MKTEMIAVYVIVAALVIVPYIAIIVFGSGKGKKINKDFKNEVKSHALNISKKESWNRHVIGVDKEKQQLIFTQHGEDSTVNTQIIDLNKVLAIDIFQKRNVVKENNKRNEFLDSLGLDFLMEHKERQTLRFYDTRVDVAQNYEMEHAEKWRELLLDLKRSKDALKNTAAA